MSTKDDSQNTGPKPNLLGNDEILEFAEEVLGSSDNDDLINLDDTNELKSEGGDEIIDLIEVADTPASEDAGILDLTEVVDESQDTDDDIIDLDEITVPPSEEHEEAIMELEDMIDDADDQEDDILDLDEMAIDPDDEDDEILDIADIEEVEITDEELSPGMATQEDEDTFIEEEELGLDAEDLASLENEVLDADGVEGTFELDDTLEIQVDDEMASADLETPDLPDVEDATAEPLELSAKEQKALEEDLSLAFEEEEYADDIFEPIVEPADTLDALDSSDFEGETIEEDVDLLDIANELAPPPAAEEQAFAEEVSTDEELPELDAMLQDEEMLSLDDTADAFEFEQPEDSGLDVDMAIPDESPVDLDADDAVDLSGFEEGQLATEMSAEIPESEMGMDMPEPDLPVEEEVESDILAEASSVTEPSTDEDSPFDLPEIDDIAGTDISAPLTDDMVDAEPEETMAAEEPVEDPPLQAAFEPEQAPEMEEPSEPAFTMGGLDVEPPEEPLIESDATVDLAIDQDLSQEPEAADSNESLELDLESEGESEKTIAIVHEGGPEKEFSPVEEPEDLSIEGISAAEDVEPPDQDIGAEPQELTGTEELANGQAPDEMAVSFDKGDSGKGLEIHSTADPISIKVKEHDVEDHANAEELLKVFDKQPGSLEGLEAAVEGVVQKVLSEKIEGLLVKAIESAVTKEIERLKGILLADIKSDDGS